jgi:hypothetical protein
VSFGDTWPFPWASRKGIRVSQTQGARGLATEALTGLAPAGIAFTQGIPMLEGHRRFHILNYFGGRPRGLVSRDCTLFRPWTNRAGSPWIRFFSVACLSPPLLTEAGRNFFTVGEDYRRTLSGCRGVDAGLPST